jgi:hypothetical protein
MFTLGMTLLVSEAGLLLLQPPQEVNREETRIVIKAKGRMDFLNMMNGLNECYINSVSQKKFFFIKLSL